MATIVHEHEHTEKERSGSMGWIIALIILLAVILLFLFAGAFFAVPNSSGGAYPANQPLPAGNIGGGANGGAGMPTSVQ
ncbi:MAG TPA: hypothetical protein VHF05_00890 [Candidatus Paceibacterota bacterium]|jgi:hypothetical protein|nr:hypothetical protein [Candidatus Paceibacterota bacterium]